MKMLIKKPLITEKNTYQNAMGIYVFEVDLKASKLSVKNFIEKSFGVKVVSVNTSVGRRKSKNTKFGPTKVSKFKKAFVKLGSGEKISLFEGV